MTIEGALNKEKQANADLKSSVASEEDWSRNESSLSIHKSSQMMVESKTKSKTPIYNKEKDKFCTWLSRKIKKTDPV